MTSSSSRPIRWWPAWLVAAGTLAAYLWVFLSPAEDNQMRTFGLAKVLIVGFLLMLLWLMLFSRLAIKRRFAVLGGLVALIVVLFSLFEIREVSGNLVPILAFRWAGEAELETGGSSAEVTASTYDFPQFFGAGRDGHVDNVELARDWHEAPPTELWRRPVGDGQSGFAVVGDAAVTFEQRNGEQVVVRYHLTTGDVVWSHGLPGSFETVIGGNGPRSTPTLDGGSVYTLGPLGGLRALDLEDGSLRWRRNVAEDHAAKTPEWGFASSPLVIDASQGRLVVVGVGAKEASLAAYRADTGEPAWQGGDDRAGYSSPVLAELAGRPQILLLAGESVTAYDPEDGSVLWSFPWSGRQPNVAMPRVLPGDKILVSSGYGIGASLLHIKAGEQGLEATELWHSPRMKAKFTNPVVHRDRVYGLDDGVMACLDPADGSRCWKGGRYGHGQNLLVGDLLLVQTEEGDVVMLEATAEEHRELGKIKALDGKSWNPPAVAGRYLLVRNSDEAVCYELPTAG